MPRFRTLFAALAIGLAGCQPQIGDPCTSSIDCSAQGDRLCDTSQPEGYCTEFNCEPDTCPEESVCLGFGSQLDPACQTESVDPRWPRFERSFCLAICETDSDCREGYACLAPGDRAAQSLDVTSETKDSKVCFRATSAPATPDATNPPACYPDSN
jgi:hypothetical protein